MRTHGIDLEQLKSIVLTLNYKCYLEDKICWDIVIMQGGVFEIAEKATYTNANIKTIQKYVQENCLNPNVKFAWHMTWVPPTDNTLRDQYPYPENNTYYSGYRAYGDDRSTMYKSVVNCVQNHIVTDETFQILIPSGTAIENALSSYLEETDLHHGHSHGCNCGGHCGGHHHG